MYHLIFDFVEIAICYIDYPYRMNSHHLVALFLFLYTAWAIDLTLISEETCLEYEITEVPSTKIFYYHYNHNTDNVKLVLYKLNSKLVMKDSG